MDIIEIKDPADSRISVFTSLTEAQLRCRTNPNAAVFIAESPKVIKVALEQGLQPVSILCEKRHIDGDAAEIIEMCDDIPVYTGHRDILASITGYKLTRGVLCAMKRPIAPNPETLLENAKTVAVLDGVCDTTNIGAIFRSAAALGIDAVILSSTTCDPLNRRSVRVSMGSVFLIPWTYIENPQQTLNHFGFKTVALALTDKSIGLNDTVLKSEPKLALILGTEGDGLDKEVIRQADFTVKIPMRNNVDSLNVGAAAAIAFWELTKR